MNWLGINQIGAFLTQGGVPAGQSQDIVIRLRAMIEAALAEARAYTDSRLAGLRDQREYDAESANNDDFFNKFKAQEQREKKETDREIIGGGAGGIDGEDGETPELPDLEDLIRRLCCRDKGGGGGGPDFPTEPECMTFRRQFENCGCDSLKKMFKVCGLESRQPGITCPGFSGRSICDILRAHANMLKKINKRLDAIEEMLRDTVEC